VQGNCTGGAIKTLQPALTIIKPLQCVVYTPDRFLQFSDGEGTNSTWVDNIYVRLERTPEEMLDFRNILGVNEWRVWFSNLTVQGDLGECRAIDPWKEGRVHVVGAQPNGMHCLYRKFMRYDHMRI
jgi:hypothetical protein